MKKIKWIILLGVLLIIITPYIYIEIQTKIYYDDFKNEYKQTNMIDGIEYFKVFDVTDTKAKIYYVEKGKLTGNYIYFKKTDNGWKMTTWHTVWSKHGSADDFTIPYYR